jgi:hypothetical protein
LLGTVRVRVACSSSATPHGRLHAPPYQQPGGFHARTHALFEESANSNIAHMLATRRTCWQSGAHVGDARTPRERDPGGPRRARGHAEPRVRSRVRIEAAAHMCGHRHSDGADRRRDAAGADTRPDGAMLLDRGLGTTCKKQNKASLVARRGSRHAGVRGCVNRRRARRGAGCPPGRGSRGALPAATRSRAQRPSGMQHAPP